ncbi:MAG: teichoic acid biosynthesis protein [Myxococcales bacterium]|nr:teichoic acid biosynthesis protein [Myxococcales bacterium]MCB9626072.1 teichoic acid biosynthesis protein [Sandaracinaceae bacterium]
MRILYGVVGEGMGHAMRSRVVLEHLFAQGHEVEIVASGRAAKFLDARFASRGDVHPIHGLHIVYDDNRVRRGSTLFSNVLEGTTKIPSQFATYFTLLEDFSPEVVISDFESWTYYFAKRHRLPIFSIDNMQILNRCTIDDDVIEGHRAEFEIAKAFVKGKLPFCDHYLVTTFFRPPVRKEHTTLFPPILRPEILAATPSRGEHLLVYQTAEGNETLVSALRATGLPCRVYGMRRAITQDIVESNLTYRPFSEDGFIADLASARGVIAGGGFTLMGECVYLHKPMLAVPVRGQFEQVLNARYLERLGYGRYAETLDDAATVHDFVAAIPGCERALAGYTQEGNEALMRALDGHLRHVAV